MGCQQYPTVPELGDLRIAKLREDGFDEFRQPLPVVWFLAIPPIQQCLRHMADGMIDGAGDWIVSVAVILEIQAQDALSKRQEVIFMTLEGFRHGLQPPTDAVRQGLHQVIRGPDDNRSHEAPGTVAQLFFRPGLQRIAPAFDRPIVLLCELAQGVGRCLEHVRAQLTPVVLLRVFEHGMR